MERTVLTAEPGYVLTNGQITGHTIYLAEGEDPAAYEQIPEQDFQQELEMV